jgi:hypothetical protein
MSQHTRLDVKLHVYEYVHLYNIRGKQICAQKMFPRISWTLTQGAAGRGVAAAIMLCALSYCQKEKRAVSAVINLRVLSKGAQNHCFFLGEYLPCWTKMLSPADIGSTRLKKTGADSSWIHRLCRPYIQC